MTKEEFISAEKQIDQDINLLMGTRRKLVSDYIESSRKFDLGQKVQIRGERFAFINGFEILSYTKEVRYLLLKCKGNGSASKHTDYCSDSSQIKAL